MRCVVLLNAALGVEAAAPAALDDSLIARVNAENGANWIAARNPRFEGVSLAEAATLLGVNDNFVGEGSGYVAAESNVSSAGLVPLQFDARAEWPNCINAIRDQGSCGSCWAFAAAEVLSDRFCIAGGGSSALTLSPQDLISCAFDNKYLLGCEGGVPEYAWRYLETTGISTEACIPYKQADSECPTACADGGPPLKYKSYGRRHLSGVATIGAVQQDMLAHGPIEASFLVYQDFFAYKSGIYNHVAGDLAGKHAVKFVGWGQASDTVKTNFWIVANSWGSDWGEQGYFRIKRGVNECGVEDSMDYGYASLRKSLAATTGKRVTFANSTLV